MCLDSYPKRLKKHKVCLIFYILQNNNSTAFGNPDYEFISGQVVGYCKAKGWIWEEKDGIISIKSGNRTFIKIEKPGIPSWEKEKRADIRKMYDDLGI